MEGSSLTHGCVTMSTCDLRLSVKNVPKNVPKIWERSQILGNSQILGTFPNFGNFPKIWERSQIWEPFLGTFLTLSRKSQVDLVTQPWVKLEPSMDTLKNIFPKRVR
jgi:hypothetical protein